MTGPALLSVALSLLAPEGAPAAEACVPDSASLAAEAATLLNGAASGSEVSAEAIAAARRLLRAARRLDASPDLMLQAADLAFAAGDVEEGGDLLAAADDTAPGKLSPAELLLLGRRAEERRRWREAIRRYDALARRLAAEGETADWIAPRRRELELEDVAAAIAAPASGPSVEARLALADAKRALASGRAKEAREHLKTALQIDPSYVDALLALAGLEAHAGRAAPAIRACRDALAAEPERVETVTLLANLLWEEPDRAAKEESLVLLDRAVALRPDLRSLLRLSAARWAQYGDAARAQERLARYLSKATAREHAEARPLQEMLSNQARAAPTPAPREPAAPEEPASAAVERWRKARILASRGDDASLNAALGLLEEAERLDPSLARAAELEASIREHRSEWREAEAALGRAIRADPSRTTVYESLARLLDRDPARANEAMDAWTQAEQAGSTEALYALGDAADRAGDGARALSLLRRYRDEAPAGLHAAEAAAALERLERRRSALVFGGATALLLALALAGLLLRRAKTGATFAEWLARHPGNAPEARRIVGRLRHESLKHGGLLLADAADRLERGDDEAWRGIAKLLEARLYGEPGSRGLVGEADDSLEALRALARADGERLNLEHRDPAFSFLARGIRALQRARPSVRRLSQDGAVSPRVVARACRLLRSASRSFGLTSGAELERRLDASSSLPVRIDALRALLARVASEADAPAPALEPIGELAAAPELPPVRLAPGDWETLWRNLFANALAAGRLGVSAVRGRDPVTGEGRLKIALCDDLASSLTTEDVLARPADRGLGVVVEILRRSDGSIEVQRAPAPGFTKGVVIELPLVETPA